MKHYLYKIYLLYIFNTHRIPQCLYISCMKGKTRKKEREKKNKRYVILNIHVIECAIVR